MHSMGNRCVKTRKFLWHAGKKVYVYIYKSIYTFINIYIYFERHFAEKKKIIYMIFVSSDPSERTNANNFFVVFVKSSGRKEEIGGVGQGGAEMIMRLRWVWIKQREIGNREVNKSSAR